MSVDAALFRSYLRDGPESPDASMFLFYDTVFPDGATERDLLRIYRPRPGLPFTPIRRADGTTRLAWTTFTPRQVDLDLDDPAAWTYLEDVLDVFAAHGIRRVRLDAVGYAAKRAGTSCFMTAETFDVMRRLGDAAHRRGLAVLVEVHSHFARQLDVAPLVDLVYDFALPPLVLHALLDGDGAPLRRWLSIRPRNAVTVLDTHDGIGVVDVGPDDLPPHAPGLLTAADLTRLIEAIHANTGGVSRRATGERAGNVDIYQINTTFYDALGRDDTRYLAARLLQLFTPGIPQIYYVGLLAGTNDEELFAATGVGRDVNRRSYSAGEVRHAIGRPVVQDLLALIRFRNTFPAFGGTWELLPGPDHEIAMRWEGKGTACELAVDLPTGDHIVTVDDGSRRRRVTSLVDLP